MLLESPAKKHRKRASFWLVRRCYFGPKRSVKWRVVGIWRARNQDDAIRKGAHAVKRIAVLQAIEIGPELHFDIQEESHAENSD